VEVVEPAETLGTQETRKRAASNTSPRGGKGKKKAREVSAGETTAVEDPPARRRRRPVYGEERGTIEVDDTAWVAMANNLVVVGGDTLRFLREWEERARESRSARLSCPGGKGGVFSAGDSEGVAQTGEFCACGEACC
jgi:hypothetical protein